VLRAAPGDYEPLGGAISGEGQALYGGRVQELREAHRWSQVCLQQAHVHGPHRARGAHLSHLAGAASPRVQSILPNLRGVPGVPSPAIQGHGQAARFSPHRTGQP